MPLPARSDHPITPIESRRAWDCRWYGVRQDRIRLPDGSEGEYNVVELPDAAWVVPVTDDGHIALLYHYRDPLGAWGWELPSGSIAAGDTALDTAQRELFEEAGGTATDWRLLMKASTMKGSLCNAAMWQFSTTVDVHSDNLTVIDQQLVSSKKR
jgi:8-oxo-dGDP phosphatase